MGRKKEVFILALFILIFLALNYGFLDTKVIEFLEESDTAIVKRVIDGDTIVTEEDVHVRLLNSQPPLQNPHLTSVRLLGINTPEKGEKYYSDAKEFLEMVSLNKTVTLKYGKEKEDRYGRTLAYIFIDGKNVNKELVDEGYANFYFPSGKDEYYSDFFRAWEHCLVNNKYLCEKSNEECARCVELAGWETGKQILVLYNNCSFSCSLKG